MLVILLVMNALIKIENGRAHAVPLTTLRIETHMGPGVVRYVSSDLFVGVHLDSDHLQPGRVEEVSLEHLGCSARIDLVALVGELADAGALGPRRVTGAASIRPRLALAA